MAPETRDFDTIFCAAIEIAASEDRAAFLADACGHDADLRRRVENLVAAHFRAGRFLETPSASPIPTADPPGFGAGTVIGPYKVLQQIGEGGMGTVFLAEQTEPVRRKVALKIIKPGMDSRQVIARFEAERQALAMMNHVNIARVLDAGATEAGRPFFVMELVHGVPITKYCDDNHLSPRERLELFVPVCQAIQHAHQKGVIHRDVKPSNVMITLYDGKPVPKVIDFGIAKATEQRLTEHTLFTQHGTMVGTLEYMSPEQAEMSALGVDTRSDIFSLGVLLYELLTGTTPLSPQRLKDAALADVLRMIKEEEPPKPSARLSDSGEALSSISAQRHMEPAKLTKLVRGELDWIVMKTLEKDRNRRYETANGLAMDLQRYLADEPVQACPPSARYRLTKFMRRNKGPVLAAGLVFLALVAGVIGTTLGLFRAEQQRRIATDNEQKALAAAEAEKKAKETAQEREAETRAVLDFLSKIIAAASPKGVEGGLGHDVALRQAIESALPFVDQSFTDQPLIEAQLRLTLGTSFWYLGEPKIAADQYDRARALYIRHRGPVHIDTIRSTHNLAMSYSALNRRADAIKLCEETLATLKATLGPDHHRTLLTANNLASDYDAARRHDEALKLNEDTLARMKAALGPDHPDTLMSTNNLANSYATVNRLQDALKLHEETLPRFKALRGADHIDTLSSMTSLANTYGALDRHEDALKLREEVLARRKDKLGLEHAETLKSMNNLAHSYAALGRHEGALKLRKETLELRKVKLGTDNSYTLQSMHSVASSLVKLDRGAEAVPLIDECVQRARGNTSVDPRVIPWSMDLRLRHFEKSKDAAGCRATVEMWEKLNRTDAASLYTAACFRAVTAAVIKEDPKTPGAEAARLASEQADEAVAWLKKALAAGYEDLTRMKKDKDLEVLRQREDFKKLAAELETKVKP